MKKWNFREKNTFEVMERMFPTIDIKELFGIAKNATFNTIIETILNVANKGMDEFNRLETRDIYFMMERTAE